MNRRVRSPRRTAIVSGGLLAILTFVLRAIVFPYYDYMEPSWDVFWMGIGSFVLLALPVYLYGKYGLLAPLIVTLGLYALAVYETWTYFQDLIGSGATMSATPTLFYLYLTLWFVPLGSALLCGGAEYILRDIGTDSNRSWE